MELCIGSDCLDIGLLLVLGLLGIALIGAVLYGGVFMVGTTIAEWWRARTRRRDREQ
jgi:hypothetical protein